MTEIGDVTEMIAIAQRNSLELEVRFRSTFLF